MNGKHRAPRKYTHIEKIRIMNDAVVFMFGCMTLVCEIRVGSFLFFEMNVILLLLGTAEICLVSCTTRSLCFPKLRRVASAKQSAAPNALCVRLNATSVKSGPSTTSKALKKESIQKGVRASGLLFR